MYFRGMNFFCIYASAPITSCAENTIEVIFVLVFDTVVIVVTLHHILGTWRLQRGRKSVKKRSLLHIILKQGVFCSLIWWESSLTENTILGILFYMYAVMSWPHCVLSWLLWQSDFLSHLVLFFLWLIRQDPELPWSSHPNHWWIDCMGDHCV